MEENTENTPSEEQKPKVYGWVAGIPAYLQEHPDNQPKKEEE